MKCSTRGCKADPSPDRKYCSKCLDKAKKRAAERYKKQRVEKRCRSCPNKATSGTLCEECKSKKNSKWQKRKADGLCVDCWKNPTKQGSSKCMDCYEKIKARDLKRKNNRLEQELCAYCDNKQVGGGSQLCLDHYLKATSRSHFGTTKRCKELSDLFLEQDGRCPYTNKKLTLGNCTSIDHIVPKSRGGSLDVSNLQWVSTEVNFMKMDMLHEEFLEAVRLIYENHLQS